MAPLRVPLKVVRLFSSIAVVPVMLSSLMGKMMTIWFIALTIILIKKIVQRHLEML
jgi:hypothetical protein